MASSLNLVSAVKPKGTAVATQPEHIEFISKLASGMFASLHAHASHHIDEKAAVSNSSVIFSDPVVAHIIADLEKILRDHFEQYEATQKAHLAAQAKDDPSCPGCKAAAVKRALEIHSHSVDLAETTHPSTPEEPVVVHSLPMEIEKGSEANPEGPH